MNNLKLISIIFGILLLWSCSEDDYQDYVAPDELSDISWLIGLDNNSEDPYSINAESHLSFIDLSQGSVSHEWTIQEGNHFLNEGFNTTDTLANFIDEDAALTITDPKAHVLFRNAGLNTVRLLNKFDEPVSYTNSLGILNAEQEGNLWVIDTTFTFDVYAKIEPAFKVFQDGVEILSVTEEDMPTIEDLDSWPTVDVEAGNSLTFQDFTTVGRSSGRSWIYPEGSPSQVGGVTASIKFFQLGVSTGSMRSFRSTPLPTASEIKLIPLKVNVIPSSEPFTFNGNSVEDENEVISFQVTGEVTPFTDQEENFIVHITNADAGYDQVIPVQSARVSTDNQTNIELTLSQPIYNSDEITISYNNVSDGITSTDTRVLQSFGPESVTSYFGGNVLPSNGWASFEPSGGGVNNAYASNQYFIPGGQGNGQFGDLVFERVTTRAFSGEASMQYKIPAGENLVEMNLFGFSFAKPNGIPAGTYQISYMVYKENATVQQFRMDFGNPITDTKLFDISSTNNNQWVKVSQVIEFPVDLQPNYRTTLRVMATDNEGIVGPQLMYFDELELIELEIRP